MGVVSRMTMALSFPAFADAMTLMSSTPSGETVMGPVLSMSVWLKSPPVWARMSKSSRNVWPSTLTSKTRNPSLFAKISAK